jgi:hypothetical protein
MKETNKKNTKTELTEQRVREIVKEEIENWQIEQLNQLARLPKMKADYPKTFEATRLLLRQVPLMRQSHVEV